jgi:hypothetical protein
MTSPPPRQVRYGVKAMQRRTFSIDNVLEMLILLELTLDKGQYQVLVPFRKHKIIKRLLVPLDVANPINVKHAPAAIAKTEALDFEVAHHELIRSELGIFAVFCS